MARAVAESMPPDSSTIASLMRLHYPDVSPRNDPFEDAALYDWEYRRRRDDVLFYRTLADERGGPILDLGCGTGRLTVPLLRAGHVVVGIDRAPAMLARAAARRADGAGHGRCSGIPRRAGAPNTRKASASMGGSSRPPSTIASSIGAAAAAAARDVLD